MCEVAAFIFDGRNDFVFDVKFTVLLFVDA